MLRVCSILLLTLLFIPMGACEEPPALPVPTDSACHVSSDSGWTPQEKFVWDRVCAGQIANFNVDPAYGGELDPRKIEHLPENRILRSSFLETLLLSEKYRRALTHNGVTIIGARFDEVLNLEGAKLSEKPSIALRRRAGQNQAHHATRA